MIYDSWDKGEIFQVHEYLKGTLNQKLSWHRCYILIHNECNIWGKYRDRVREKKYISPWWWLNPKQVHHFCLIPKMYYTTPIQNSWGRDAAYGITSPEWIPTGTPKFERKLISGIIELLPRIHTCASYSIGLSYKPGPKPIRIWKYKLRNIESFNFYLSMYTSWLGGLLKEYE